MAKSDKTTTQGTGSRGPTQGKAIGARRESQIPSKAEGAVKAAYYRALGSGHAVLIIEDGKLVRVYKEERTILREVGPNVEIPKGTKFKLK